MGSNLYDWYGLNHDIFFLINKSHTPTVDSLMLLVTSIAHPRLFPLYITILLVFAWFRPSVFPLRNVVVFSVSYLFASVLIIPLLKSYFDLPRPITVLGEQQVTVLGSPDAVQSFPSGHSAYAVLLAAALFPGTPFFIKIALVVFASLVCVSRIFVGAHFPADVVGGSVIALAVVFVVRQLIKPPRAKVHPPVSMSTVDERKKVPNR